MDINISKLENGNLRLTVDSEMADELRANLEARGFWSAFCDLLEPFSANGSYEPFDAGDANPFVGLTSAPCIAECMDYADDGTKSIDGNFWYFDRYMIDCPLETLADSNEVIFTLARD